MTVKNWERFEEFFQDTNLGFLALSAALCLAAATINPILGVVCAILIGAIALSSLKTPLLAPAEQLP